MKKIDLYEDINYKGRVLEVTENLGNLKIEDFNDKVLSCKIKNGTWMLYTDISFQGKVSIRSEGNYASSKAMGLPNHTLSSLRSFPEASEPTILLFKDTDYQGRMVVLTASESNFKNIDFNDVVSSAIVLKGEWQLFEDIDFEGVNWILNDDGAGKPGYYSDYSSFKNDCISSAKLKK